jgi:hypothetical protein
MKAAEFAGERDTETVGEGGVVKVVAGFWNGEREVIDRKCTGGRAWFCDGAIKEREIKVRAVGEWLGMDGAEGTVGCVEGGVGMVREVAGSDLARENGCGRAGLVGPETVGYPTWGEDCVAEE